MGVVYVETNFVLELAFEQEQAEACGEIVAHAAERKLSLVIPAFALAEPHPAIDRRASLRSRVGDELRPLVRELGRSRSLRHLPGSFDALAAVLIGTEQLERQNLRKTIERLFNLAEVIPLTRPILAAAAEAEDRFGISGQDAIVLSSVLADRDERQPDWSCFLNRNSKDFDDPDIRKQLSDRNCRFISSFDQGFSYIRSLTGGA